MKREAKQGTNIKFRLFRESVIEVENMKEFPNQREPLHWWMKASLVEHTIGRFSLISFWITQMRLIDVFLGGGLPTILQPSLDTKY